MAGRRMFSRAITGTGSFLDLPGDAQALYFLLGMEADDDGFVEGKVLLRMAQKTEADLRLLEREGLIQVFGPHFITHIVDWTVNNQIRRDRYTKSRYAALLEEAPQQAEAPRETEPEQAEPEEIAEPEEPDLANPIPAAPSRQTEPPYRKPISSRCPNAEP